MVLGEVYYAANVVGRFVIPSDWVNEPYTTTCSLRASKPRIQPRRRVATVPAAPAAACASEFCHTPSCTDGSDFTLVVELDAPLGSDDMIQFAVDTAESWQDGTTAPPMLTCGTTDEFDCTVSGDMLTVTYENSFTSTDIKYAVNVIGRFVKPDGDWSNEPYEYTCGDPVPTEPPITGPTDPPEVTPAPTGPPVDPGDCAAPEVPACPNAYDVIF